MRTLILFFWKNRFFTLFVILETLSLILLVKSYSYQKSLAFNTVNDISGALYEFTSNVRDYYTLGVQNAQLSEENARLKNQLQKTISLHDDSVTTPFEDTSFYYISAKVISNSVNKRNNYILVNKGFADGVEKEMGVVSTNGLAGVVIGVSEHYALIMSMLHKNANISARIKKNNQLVRVVWNNDDYRMGTVMDIPSHISLENGDTVVTSGNSLIFPPGVVIGTVEKFFPDNTKSLTYATLHFSTDFNSLYWVYLIQNKNRKEQEELMKEAENE